MTSNPSNFKPATPQLKLTADGSHTLVLDHIAESYHSDAGALTESIHVYIEQGLLTYTAPGPLHVLEVGLGTGMNAVLTCYYADLLGRPIYYQSLEPYPVPEPILSQVQMGKFTQKPEYKAWLQTIHNARHNEPVALHPHFEFTVFHEPVQDFPMNPSRYDIIYYDAFAPSKQPEMWSLALLTQCVNALKPGGIFITYCANGQFKRNLKGLGMTLFNPPGIGPRRQITRAVKPMS